MKRLTRGLAMVLAMLVVLSACSRLEFAYNRADWFIAREVAGLLDLNDEQRQYVRNQVQEYREFHRRQRVPELITYIDDTLALFDSPSVDLLALKERVESAQQIWRHTATDIIPTSVDILQRLSPAQIEHLRQELKDRRDEKREETESDRTDKLFERVETWTGSLSSGQKDYLRSCRARLPDTRDQWLQWREQRDARLVRLLHTDVDRAELEAFLTQWWVDLDARPETLRKARVLKTHIWLDCAQDFIAEHLTTPQRNHAQGELQNYRHALAQIATATE